MDYWVVSDNIIETSGLKTPLKSFLGIQAYRLNDHWSACKELLLLKSPPNTSTLTFSLLKSTTRASPFREVHRKSHIEFKGALASWPWKVKIKRTYFQWRKPKNLKITIYFKFTDARKGVLYQGVLFELHMYKVVLLNWKNLAIHQCTWHLHFGVLGEFHSSENVLGHNICMFWPKMKQIFMIISLWQVTWKIFHLIYSCFLYHSFSFFEKLCSPGFSIAMHNPSR